MVEPEYVGFGLIGVPEFARRPIASQMDGFSFSELPSAKAAVVVEGLVYLQWIRAGVVGAAAIGMAYAAQFLPSPLRTLALLVANTLLLWLPMYMLALVPAWVSLRRCRRDIRPLASGQAAVLVLMRWAPLIALGCAGVGAFLIAS